MDSKKLAEGRARTGRMRRAAARDVKGSSEFDRRRREQGIAAWSRKARPPRVSKFVMLPIVSVLVTEMASKGRVGRIAERAGTPALEIDRVRQVEWDRRSRLPDVAWVTVPILFMVAMYCHDVYWT
jgi:hypothetical protein